MRPLRAPFLTLSLALGLVAVSSRARLLAQAPETKPPDAQTTAAPEAPARPEQDPVALASVGCLSCHTGIEDAHESKSVRVGCTDCHGGKASFVAPAGLGRRSKEYARLRREAHVAPTNKKLWKSTANPVRSYTALNQESSAFLRFVNPGDLRVARESCGSGKCHPSEVTKNRHSMMAHGAMLWEAALYNNGATPSKRGIYGEFYGADGKPQSLQATPSDDAKKKGALSRLDPLPPWNISQPSNVLRVFERGGNKRADTGIPNIFEEPGAPESKLSNRGFGTQLRTDPVFLGLQKTRLLDPTLNFMGTNDHPGDYRSSGCTSCHFLYANDRDPLHSGPIAKYGNRGLSATADPTIPKDEPGHPIRHRLTRAIPSSQCMVCHVHPGTNVLTTYYGQTWWDNETDGSVMYPKTQVFPTAKVRSERLLSNPEEASIRGFWGDGKFLENLTDLNPQLKRTRFADYHGHGWVFRDVFKHDDKGNWLDADGKIVPDSDPKKFDKAVHLKDIHLEKGMHCVDCHFAQDNHGDGNLYGEVRAATAVECVDCHGTIDKKATLTLTGNAGGGESVKNSPTPFGPRFKVRGGKIIQQSAVDPDVKWEVVQVADTIDPASAVYNERSRLAKTMQRDATTWGSVPADSKKLAHDSSNMSCYACHTAWAPSCFGCHLPQRANERTASLHNEGKETRNGITYNFQTLRDDMYMLGHDGAVKNGRITPIRSSCAVLVSSQNANREWIYHQQQTVSAEGFAGTAFSPFTPHTVRAKETKTCTDCHVSQKGDNNAKMAQLLMLGTNFYNFIGRYCWVGQGKEGIEAVVVTEHDEPQAVIGSDLHKLAFPDDFRKHQARQGQLEKAYEHGGNALSLQLRGEYLYVAGGKGGLRVYDVANIDNKGFSERIVTAPVSPLGQKFYVKSKAATAVASPTTLGVDPTRAKNPENLEGKIHPMYGYLYVTDSQEGLIVVGAATLLDGDPTNNFLKRALTWNPDGVLKGASAITIAGTTAYICADAGVVIVSLEDPLKPKVLTKLGRPWLTKPRAVEVQFRYAFIIDQTGLKVADVTFPDQARVVAGASVPIEGANDVYVARTYAYVAAGKNGLAIIDVQKPEDPVLEQMFTANGAINDARQVKIGMTNNSLFAYLADGKNGLRVIQLLSPEQNPEIWGFSPKPTPRLIATKKTHGEALAVSKGLDRDRAVDESGNQLSVFGRRGARPFDLEEMRRLYIVNGKLMRVSDSAPSKPLALTAERSLEPPPLRLPEPKLIADEDFVGLVRRAPAVERSTGTHPGGTD
ncbi:MAG: hypothetical protein ABIT01_05010 [Thermoanaerobaculia bacterium]